MSLIHRVVPHFILENYAAGNLSGELSAVGLFADMSGFSAITDELMTHGQHGAEILAIMLRKAFHPMIQSVYEQGGFIASQAGDAFTALFPFTTDAQTAIQAALTASLDIQRHIQAQARQTTPYGEFTIAVKIGLALGQTAWGVLESQNKQQAVFYFRGPAIEESARAEFFAAREQIILAPSLYKAAQSLLRVEPAKDHFQLLEYLAPLNRPQPVEPSAFDPELTSRFFPKDLITQRFEGEFRQIVSLFVALPNVEELNPILQVIFKLQTRYGGLIKLYFGDKGPHLLIIWGAPVAYENDIERALSFILELQKQTETPLHAGITHRIAHAGFIGSTLSEEYATFGRGVNLAARFMTSSQSGEIWVDEWVVQRAQDNFIFQYNDAYQFKGFAEPQKVFVLLGRKPVREFEYVGKMFGRETEIQELEAFTQPIFAGQHAGLMTIFGEAGIGKSRLVYDFLARIPKKQAIWFLAQANQLLRESLNPFRYWLRHYFGIADQLGEAQNKHNFASKLDDLIAFTTVKELAGELERTRTCLGALLGLRWPDSFYEQLDAESRYENILIGLTTLIQAESLRQPVILLFEDIQWLDADSANYLPRLLRTLTANEKTQYPVAVIATCRYEEPKIPLATLPHHNLELEGLDRNALSELAQAHLGGAVSTSLLDAIEARAEGNPFFAEQILRYAQKDGLLAEQDGRWHLIQVENLSALPDDVNTLLIARLDQLVQEVKEIVQAAAILGREFETHVLARLLELQDLGVTNLTAALQLAQNEAVLAALSEIRYIFRHALLWDAAYNMQLHARRQKLHSITVNALESLYAEDLSGHYGELAYHAERALMTETARDYLIKAAEIAKNAYQLGQADEYYTRALGLTPPTDISGEYDLLLARLEIYKSQGKHEERQRDLLKLMELARLLDDTNRLLEAVYQQAEAAFERGETQKTADLCQDAVQTALAEQNTRVAIALYSLLGYAMDRLNQFEPARDNIEKGLQLARRTNNIAMESKLLNAYGMLYAIRGNPSQASERFQQSLALARQIGDLRLQARPLTNLGLAALQHGNFLEARQYSEQSLILVHQIGARTGEAVILGNLGFIAANLGDFDRALDYTETYLRITREIGQRYYEVTALINLSAQLGALGEIEPAIRHARDAIQLAQEIEEQPGLAWAHTYLGHHLAVQEQHTEASKAYQTAVQIWEGLNQHVLATEPLAGLARLALAQSSPILARQHVEEILPAIEQSDCLIGTDDPLRVYFTCYQVLAPTRDIRAYSLLETAYALLQARANQIPDEVNRQKFLARNENQAILTTWEAL